MPDIKIEEYKGFYDEEIMQHILEIASVEFGLPVTKTDQPDLCNICDFYQKGKGNFFLAFCDGVLVGTIGLLDLDTRQMALRKMFVNKNFRGRPYKIAQNLLEKALIWAQDQDTKHIFLGTTEVFLSAHRFYEKNKVHN